MMMDKLYIGGRAASDAVLYLLGLLNVKPLLAGNGTGKPSVAFLTYSIHLAQFYQSIIKDLRKEEPTLRVDFLILCHPHFPWKSMIELKDYAHSTLGIPEDDVKFFWQALWERYDLVICNDVFARFPLRARKVWLLSHGPALPERFFERSLLHKSIRDFEDILVSGDYDYRLVTDHGGNGISGRVFSAGCAFMDGIESPYVSRDEYFRELSLDPGKKTVLIGPHWKGLALAGEKGSTYFDDVISALKGLNYNVLIKPHACSYNRSMAKGVNWRKRIKGLRQSVDFDVDDRPALKYADVLITDISSRAFAFMLLGKPVIQYFPARVDFTLRDSMRLKLMQQGLLIASSPDDIRALLERIHGGEVTNPMADTVARECFSHQGKATKFVVEMIKNEIKKL